MLGLNEKLEVMGVGLNMETYKELFPFLEQYFKDSQLHTICAISRRMLMMAQKDQDIKAVLNQYDLALPGEVGILAQANVKEGKIVKEIKENLFFKSFIEWMIETEKRLYLLGETDFQVIDLKNYILKQYPKAMISGVGFLADGKEVFALMNEINVLAPDVILSVIPSPNQEIFVKDRRSMLDAKLFYGMNGNYRLNTATRRIGEKFRSFVHSFSFKELVARYHKEYGEK